MGDMLDRIFSLGLGAVVVTKEQAEKLVDELVKKGEVKREESGRMTEELYQRGKDAKEEFDAAVEKRAKDLYRSLNLATKEDITRLEERIAALEADRRREQTTIIKDPDLPDDPVL